MTQATSHFCRSLLFLFIMTASQALFAGFTNYNSVMLGERAGGMGTAATALAGDPASGAYYNPATLARLEGSTLSGAINLFNKYDTSYGTQSGLDDAVFRINKGSILTLPSATGIFSSFRSFSAGLSIVVPDYSTFGGDVYRSGEDSTFLRYDEQSLWIGGVFAFNMTDQFSFGLTTYYTSQTYSRSLTNRYDDAGDDVIYTEEKSFTQNAIIYIIGAYYEINPKWQVGLSYRFRSIQINGEGSYLQSQIGTVSGAQPIVQDNKIDSESRIPDRLALGFVYTKPRNITWSFDVTYHGSNRYQDFDQYGDIIEQQSTFNYALGVEKYLTPWLAARAGVFTDYSSTPGIPQSPLRRYQDNIDKQGFSLNFSIHTTEHTMLTLGGYYLGGDGHASERVGDDFERLTKSERLFSFLVGSSYSF